jgi:hypothetical protein
MRNSEIAAVWIDRLGTRIVLTDANEAVEVYLPAGWDAPRRHLAVLRTEMPELMKEFGL